MSFTKPRKTNGDSEVFLIASCSHPTAVLLRSYSDSTRILPAKTPENHEEFDMFNYRKVFPTACFASYLPAHRFSLPHQRYSFRLDPMSFLCPPLH